MIKGVDLKKDAIVGIDPGLNTAIALVDLEGNAFCLKSARNLSFEKIISTLSDFCSPVLIASDVSPPPGLVERAASSFSVRVFHPPESLQRKMKAEIIKTSVIKPGDNHQRDALAAALNAYREIRPLLVKIDKKISELNSTTGSKGEIARNVLSGQSRNINIAIRSLDRDIAIKKTGSEKRRRGDDIQTTLRLKDAQISELKNLLSVSRERCSSLEKEILKMKTPTPGGKGFYAEKNRADVLRGNIDSLHLQAKKLRNEMALCVKANEDYGRLMTLVTCGWLPAIFSDYCDKYELSVLDKKYGLAGKWLCIEMDGKFSGADAAKKAEGIFCTGKTFRMLGEAGVKVLDIGKFRHLRKNDFGAIEIGKDELKEASASHFAGWLEKYKKMEIR